MGAEGTAVAVSHRRAGERTLLPFRVEAGPMRGYPTTTLVYEGEVVMLDGSRKRQVYTLAVGIQLGAAVMTLIDLYRKLEAEADALVRERDHLLDANRQMEGKIIHLENRVAGYESKEGRESRRNGPGRRE